MTSVQIGLKIEEGIKNEIDSLIKKGKYRHISDFLHRAIAEELERGGKSPEDYQLALTFRAIESEEGVALIKKIIDKKREADLLERGPGDQG